MRKSTEGNRNLISVKQKLQDAVTLAKTTLHPPLDIITLNGASHDTYVIVENLMIDGVSWLYIFGSGSSKKREVLFSSPKDKFRAIVFVGFTDARIFVMEKVLKLTFLYCSKCQISIRGGSIGPVEFIRCISTNVDIRGNASKGETIPIVQIDMSTDVHFYQRSDEIVYAVCGCTDITGVIVDTESGLRIKETPMKSSIFGEQTFLLFSKTEGIVQIQERYALNNIIQHLMFHDEVGDDEGVYDEGTSETLSFSPT